jgi:hypothetical protein
MNDLIVIGIACVAVLGLTLYASKGSLTNAGPMPAKGTREYRKKIGIYLTISAVSILSLLYLLFSNDNQDWPRASSLIIMIVAIGCIVGIITVIKRNRNK